MAYADYDELVKGVKKDYPEKTTDDRFMEGLNRVAPPGKVADEKTAKLYEDRTDADAATRLVDHWGTSRLFRSR